MSDTRAEARARWHGREQPRNTPGRWADVQTYINEGGRLDYRRRSDFYAGPPHISWTRRRVTHSRGRGRAGARRLRRIRAARDRAALAVGTARGLRRRARRFTSRTRHGPRPQTH